MVTEAESCLQCDEKNKKGWTVISRGGEERQDFGSKEEKSGNEEIEGIRNGRRRTGYEIMVAGVGFGFRSMVSHLEGGRGKLRKVRKRGGSEEMNGN